MLDFEWLIVDSISVDETKKFVDNLLNENLLNIRYIRKKDHGIFEGMNNGIKHASGDYLIFMNSGDRFASPRVVETILKLIELNPQSELICGASFELNKDGKRLLKLPLDSTHSKLGMITHHQAMFFKRSSIGLYDEKYTLSADYAKVTELVLRRSNIVSTSVPVCIFERGGASQTNITTLMREYKEILKSYYDYNSIYINLLVLRKRILHIIRRNLTQLYDFLRFQNVQD